MHHPPVSPGTPARSTTPLRPSGKVSIDGRTFDARAAGAWIDADQPVSVHRIDGFGLVVGPPGTTPPNRDDRPADPDGVDPDAPRPMTRLERHLSGLIAFGALGTGAGGIVLLVLAFRVRPVTLLYLLVPILIAGASAGAGIYALVCLAFGSWRRLVRRAERRGGMLAQILGSPLEVILVLTLLGIVVAGVLMATGSGSGGSLPVD